MILPNLMCLGVMAFLLWRLLDHWLGSALLEKVEVQEKRFVVARPNVTGRSFYSSAADTFNFRVANANGTGWVQVTQQDYEKMKEGDRLFVSGTKGRFTGHWYLESARKKR